MASTVLVVDDEPVVLQVVVQILELAGFSVLKALRGRDALHEFLCSEGHVDLLLTDIIMQGMNGVELARSILDHQPGTPILFMSGNASQSREKDLLLAHEGMEEHAVLAKPFRPKQLVEAVNTLLRRAEANRVLLRTGVGNGL